MEKLGRLGQDGEEGVIVSPHRGPLLWAEVERAGRFCRFASVWGISNLGLAIKEKKTGRRAHGDYRRRPAERSFDRKDRAPFLRGKFNVAKAMPVASRF